VIAQFTGLDRISEVRHYLAVTSYDCHGKKKVSGLDEAGQWRHGLGKDGLDNEAAIFFKWRDILVF
jgi:hypothetical protein